MPTSSEYKPVLMASGGVVVLWLVSWTLTGAVKPHTSVEAGLFGDSFGGLNALFSGLAFAFLVAAVLLQREELRLQKLEAKRARLEIGRQQRLSENRDYHQSFMWLVQLHEEGIRSLSLRAPSGTVHSGREAFNLVADWMTSSSTPEETWWRILRENGALFARYLGGVELLVERALGAPDQALCLRILKAFLTSQECQFLAYHRSYGSLSEKFEAQLAKSALLEDLSK